MTGIYLAVSRIPEFVLYIAMLFQSGSEFSASNTGLERAASAAMIAGLSITTAIGVALILLRDRVAQRLFPTDAAPLEVRGIQTAAFSVMGVYFAVHGISRISWSGPFAWGTIIQIVLGVALFLGARGLARFWLQIQQRVEAAQRAT